MGKLPVLAYIQTMAKPPALHPTATDDLDSTDIDLPSFLLRLGKGASQDIDLAKLDSLAHAVKSMRGPNIDHAVRYLAYDNPDMGGPLKTTLADVVNALPKIIGSARGVEEELTKVQAVRATIEQFSSPIPNFLLAHLIADVATAFHVHYPTLTALSVPTDRASRRFEDSDLQIVLKAFSCWPEEICVSYYFMNAENLSEDVFAFWDDSPKKKPWDQVSRELKAEVLDGGLGVLRSEDRTVVESSFARIRKTWEDSQRFISLFTDRLNDKSNSKPLPTIAERAQQFAEFAKANGAVGLEEYARLVFPEWSAFQTVKLPMAPPELPTEAPERYQGLRGPETPPDFVKRVYGEWLGQGLTRAHIRSLDPKLYTAIENWSRKNEWPQDVDLPTLKEQNTRWVERVTQHGADDLTLREARRLESALHRRRGRSLV